MIELLTSRMLSRYLAADTISARLDALSRQGDEALTCQRWLRETPAKRLIYAKLYGDLLEDGPRLKVLDVGGGLMALTRQLAMRHDYTLVDVLAHDTTETAERMQMEVGRQFISQCDWYKFEAADRYDIVVANDLFPNVDQRLELFLQRFLSRAARLRLALTFFNKPRFYLTRRMDADEVFCMLAWNGRATRGVLEQFLDRGDTPKLSIFDQENPSLYPNERQVCLLEMRGSRETSEGPTARPTP